MKDLPTSDIEREKLRKQMLELMNYEGLDAKRPIVALSLEALRSGKLVLPLTIPPPMQAMVGWPPQVWFLSSEDLDLMPGKMWPEERERFDRGEPVLIRLKPIGLRSSMPNGGQPKDDIEEQAGDAFAVGVFVIFERLRYLVPLRDGKNVCNWLNQEAAKDAIFKRELLPLPWPASDYRKTDKERLDHIDTAWSVGKRWDFKKRNGQRRKILGRLYPCRPGQLRDEIAIWADSYRNKRRQEIEEEIRFLKTQFVSLNLCRERAREFRRAENEISKFISEHQDDDKNPDRALMEAAAGFNLRVDLGDAAPAAYAGDFDPRLIFLRLESIRSFEFIQQLGKTARGNVPEWSPGTFAEHIAESRQVLNDAPELLSERRHPELMSGREFLLYAYAAYERQRAAIDSQG